MFFFFNDTATTEIYTLSLHDALPISVGLRAAVHRRVAVHQWRGLPAVEPHGDILPGIPEQGLHAFPARSVRGVGDHAVARDQRGPAAGAGWRAPPKIGAPERSLDRPFLPP